MATPSKPAADKAPIDAYATMPPLIAMTFLAVVLVAMVQFQSTERLAAAFAWLIFVAVFLANGQQALDNMANVVGIYSKVDTFVKGKTS
jgi:hypothetical protein